MKVFLDSRQEIVDLDSPRHRGGEGEIYVLRDQVNRAVKVYLTRTPERVAKLRAMLDLPPPGSIGGGYVEIAWPLAAVRSADAARELIGFEMLYTDRGQQLSLTVNPKARPPHSDFSARLRIARNIAWGASEIHGKGHVIGDLQPDNLLVRDTFVTFVDVDSFQIRDRNGKVFRCPVGRADYTAPELHSSRFEQIDRHPRHDVFALAVIIFQLLMEGNHPFASHYLGPGVRPSLAERIRRGCFPYADPAPREFRPRRAAPPFDVLHADLQNLMRECFQYGHSDPNRRPDASAWKATLEAALADRQYLQDAEKLLARGSPGMAASITAGLRRSFQSVISRRNAKPSRSTAPSNKMASAIAAAGPSALAWTIAGLAALAAIVALFVAGTNPTAERPVPQFGPAERSSETARAAEQPSPRTPPVRQRDRPDRQLRDRFRPAVPHEPRISPLPSLPRTPPPAEPRGRPTPELWRRLVEEP